MLNNQDFANLRAKSLGGSDIGAILGVNRYRSAVDVWLEKTGRKVPQINNLATRYRLDPLCDEISLMETASGMSPFITIDGWVKLINSHEQFAGMSLREPSELVNELPA